MLWCASGAAPPGTWPGTGSARTPRTRWTRAGHATPRTTRRTRAHVGIRNLIGVLGNRWSCAAATRCTADHARAHFAVPAAEDDRPALRDYGWWPGGDVVPLGGMHAENAVLTVSMGVLQCAEPRSSSTTTNPAGCTVLTRGHPDTGVRTIEPSVHPHSEYKYKYDAGARPVGNSHHAAVLCALYE